MTIASSQNQRLKEIRKLVQRRRWRDQAGRFVAEGEDLLEAADAAGWTPVQRYCAAGSGLAGVEIEPRLLASASGLASGTRTLAVYEERFAQRPLGPLCVYLHGVHDAGNVGAVLRAAHAFGASCVALGPGSADPFSPKTVRASMGAVFAVPIARAGALHQLPGQTVALVADAAAAPLPELAWPEGELTLLIGSEREGLPESIVAAVDRSARIPIEIDSLNAAMAATVALYEVTRSGTRMARA